MCSFSMFVWPVNYGIGFQVVSFTTLCGHFYSVVIKEVKRGESALYTILSSHMEGSDCDASLFHFFGLASNFFLNVFAFSCELLSHVHLF